MAKTFLECAGDITVDTARSVPEAMRKLDSCAFDAIVSDDDLPPQNGLALLQALRRKGLDTPFLIYTGKGNEQAMIRALAYGADDWLQKGGDPKAEFTELAHRIRSAVDQKKTLKILHDTRETVEYIRCIIETVGIPLVVVDENLCVISANPSFYETFHITPGSAVGLPLQRIGEGQWEIPALRNALARIFSENTPVENLEIEQEFPVAGRKVMLLSGRELVRPGKASRLVLLSLEDITRIKQTETRIRESERRLTDIINFLPDATFAIDREGVVIAWNRAMEELTGIPASEMVGKGEYTYSVPFYQTRRPILIDMVFQPDEVIARYYTGIRREKQALMAETCTRLPDGTEAYLWAKATPLYDEQGELVGSIESIRNITELRETEKVLKESEDRYRAIFENSGTAMVIVEEDGVISLANSESVKLLDYTREEVEHLLKWDKFVPEHEKARLGAYFRNRQLDPASTPRQFESELVDKHGTIKYGLFNTDLIPGTRRHIVSVMDITAHKRAMEKIDHLNHVLGAIRDVNWTITQESNRTRIIQGICDILIDARGYLGACIALVGEDWTVTDVAKAGVIGELLPYLGTNGDATLPEHLRRVLDSRRVFLRTVETPPCADPPPGSPAEERKAMSVRLEHHGQLYGLLKVVVPRDIPIDREETAVFQELARDIAYALYNADLEEEHHYHDALKMANNKLNLLSGITRHDILNQTTGMSGLLALLAESVPADPTTEEYLGYLFRAVDTIRRQISFTRDYENLGMVAPEWFSVESLVQTAAATANLREVRLAITTGPLEVFADPMLEMVFVNLIDNALRHGETVTGIQVSFEPREGGGRIVIEDDGAGVPPDIKDLIFEKGIGDNTGYGLFLVREILGITGMIIQETGTYGEGARFDILVPAERWRMGRPAEE